MSKERVWTGKLGEDIAISLLRKNGYEIIERNFKFSRFGEIDIIAKDKDTVAFIEVRTRKGEDFGTPFESVNLKKQKKLEKLSNAYIKKRNLNFSNFRFDVVGIILNKNNVIKDIKLIKDAFMV